MSMVCLEIQKTIKKPHSAEFSTVTYAVKGCVKAYAMCSKIL